MKRMFSYLSLLLLLVVLALGVQVSSGTLAARAGQNVVVDCPDCSAKLADCLAKAKNGVDQAKCEADFEKCNTQKCPDKKP